MLHHYTIRAISKATGCVRLCYGSKYEYVTTGKCDLPLSCVLMKSKVSACGTVVAIFGSLWTEVVATIQNPLNATRATGRGLWDRTILLSKGIRVHTTWPLSFSVCVSQMTRLPVLPFSSRLYRDGEDSWDWNFKWSVMWVKHRLAVKFWTFH